MWAIQYVEVAKDAVDAQQMLDWVRQQDGYIGGRVLPKSHDGRPDRMQAFFQDEPGVDPALLPDGLRRVFIPDGQKRAMGIRCVCHAGSVCNEACAAGRCHTGCAFEVR